MCVCVCAYGPRGLLTRLSLKCHIIHITTYYTSHYWGYTNCVRVVFNSLTPEICGCFRKPVIVQPRYQGKVSWKCFVDKSASVQIMVWCRQETRQPYGVTESQWDKMMCSSYNPLLIYYQWIRLFMAIMQCWSNLFGTKLGHHWFIKSSMPSYYLHTCWRFVRRTLTKTNQWNCNQINKKKFVEGNAFKKLFVIIAAINCRPPYVQQASANT